MYIYIIEKLKSSFSIKNPEERILSYTEDSSILKHFSLEDACFIQQIETKNYTLNQYEIQNTNTASIFLCHSCTSTLTIGTILSEYKLFSPWDILLSALQTKGRGQKGKQWDSLSGNFLGTLLLPNTFFFKQSISSLFLGAILVKALEYPPYFSPKIKWPNDIVYMNKKVAGMLIIEHEDTILWGIGINLLHISKKTTPNALASGSLSQYIPIKDLPTISSLSLSIIETVQKEVSCFAQKDSKEYIAYIEESLAYKGEDIHVHSSPMYTAICLTITEDGELIVKTKDNTIKTLSSETIRPITP